MERKCTDREGVIQKKIHGEMKRDTHGKGNIYGEKLYKKRTGVCMYKGKKGIIQNGERGVIS